MSLFFAVFIVSLILILWSSEILPRALGGIAEILKLSQFVTAFLLVAFATSIPELFVGVFSATQGIPLLSLGNILGANLANVSLVIGASVLIGGMIHGDGKISSQNFWLVFLIALLPVLLAMDGLISRGDGLLLLLAFALYIGKLFRDKEHFTKELAMSEHKELRSIKHIFHHVSRFVFGSAILITSAFALIWSAKYVVVSYFSSEYLLFGAIFVALGTTLPELTFGIRAVMAKQGQAMLGGALGSIAFNAAAIVGIVALIRPIAVPDGNFLLVSAALFVAFLLFHFFVYTKNRITRLEASVLLLVYVVFVGVSLLT